GANGRFEDDEAIRTADGELTCALWMRHQADDVAPLVAEAGDVRDRSVGIRFASRDASRIRVAEDDLPILLEARDDVRLRVIVAFAVGNRNAKRLAGTARQ